MVPLVYRNRAEFSGLPWNRRAEGVCAVPKVSLRVRVRSPRAAMANRASDSAIRGVAKSLDFGQIWSQNGWARFFQ